MRGRTPSIRSKWHLPKKCYRLAVEYALNYDQWKAEIRSLRDQSTAIRYDKDKVQSSCTGSPTEAAAIRSAELQSKIAKIDQAITEASDGMDEYVRLHVCNEYTYYQLTHGAHRMPLNKNQFGELCQHFYYILYQLI